MSEERKPCPRCGKRPYIVPLAKVNENLDPWAQYDPASQVITKYFAECVCGLKSDEKDTQAEAVAAWNKLCDHYLHYPWEYGRDQRAKADKGKAQISKVPPQIVFDIAEVREYGNRKYGDPDNWKTVEPERYIDAAGRHYWAMVRDPYGKDEESGIEHYKHLACNLAFLCEMLKGGRKETEEGGDDEED